MQKSKQKPNKPRPSFPLTPHPNGQWCKKIRGRVHFFGVWADPDAALARYNEHASDLHIGLQRQGSTVTRARLSVKDACNAFLGWQKDRLDAKEIHPRSFKEYLDFSRHFAKTIGEHRPLASLRPDDFQRYRGRLAKRLAPSTLAKRITILRSVFKYAYESDLLDRPMKFGHAFTRPSATLIRKARRKTELENGKRLFTREQLEAILAASDRMLHVQILLGLNVGFGNSDLGNLPISAVDLDRGIIEYYRTKTGVQRIAPLWPETVDALRRVLNGPRACPVDKEAAKLVFLSRAGKPLVRQVIKVDDDDMMKKITHIDDISDSFAVLLRKLNIYRPGLSFYALRHQFRTWADETHDQHAIHRIMGHAIPGMSGIYVEEISLVRLRAVVEHVRGKVFG